MYLVGAFCTSDYCNLRYEWRSAITWLGYVNSSINPLIYSFTNKDFKLAFKRIICCVCNSPSITIDSTVANAHGTGMGGGISTTGGGGNYFNDHNHHYQTQYRSYASTNDPFNLRHFSSSRTYNNGIEFDATSSASCTGTFTGVIPLTQQSTNANVNINNNNNNNNNGSQNIEEGSTLSQLQQQQLKSPITSCLKPITMTGSGSRDRHLNVMFDIPSPSSPSSLTPEFSGLNCPTTSGSYGNISIDSSTSNSIPVHPVTQNVLSTTSGDSNDYKNIDLSKAAGATSASAGATGESKLNSVKILTSESGTTTSLELIYSGQSETSSSSLRPSTLQTSITTSTSPMSSNLMPFVKSQANVPTYIVKRADGQSGSFNQRCNSSFSSIDSFKVKESSYNDDTFSNKGKFEKESSSSTTVGHTIHNSKSNESSKSQMNCPSVTSTLASVASTLSSERKSSRRFRMLTRQKKCANENDSVNDSDETGVSGPRSTVSLLSSQSSLISMVDKCNSPLISSSPLSKQFANAGSSCSNNHSNHRHNHQRMSQTNSIDNDTIEIPSIDDCMPDQSNSSSATITSSNQVTSSSLMTTSSIEVHPSTLSELSTATSAASEIVANQSQAQITSSKNKTSTETV